MKKPETKTAILFDCPRFDSLNAPEGFLIDTPACHALWYYFCLVSTQNENFIAQQRYEGELDHMPEFHNRKQLFTSIALMYGVMPEEMVKHWPSVDMQCTMMGGKKLSGPERFDNITSVRTN